MVVALRQTLLLLSLPSGIAVPRGRPFSGHCCGDRPPGSPAFRRRTHAATMAAFGPGDPDASFPDTRSRRVPAHYRPGTAQRCPRADQAAEPASLTLGQAVERALASNPALQGFAYTLQAQDARIAAAGQRPVTEASFELENVLGSGDFNGMDEAEATFALSSVVELGDKRRLRTAAAEAGRDLLSIERQAAQLDVLADVARRFIHVAALQEQLELTVSATAARTRDGD